MARMSVPDSAATDSADLDTTAELPALDVTIYEALQGRVQLGRADMQRDPAVAALAAAAEDAAVEHRSRLEQDLKALTANLRDFEDRLASKGARLSAIERDLETAAEARALAEQHGATLARELEASSVVVTAARAEVQELRELLARREGEIRATALRADTLASEVARRDQALLAVQLQLLELQQQSCAQMEILSTTEVRRGARETLVRGLEAEIAQRDVRLEALNHDLDLRGSRATRLAAQLDVAERRLQALEAELGELATAHARKIEEINVVSAANAQLRTRVGQLTSADEAHVERLRSIETDVDARTQASSAAQLASDKLQHELEETHASYRRRIDVLETELGTLQVQLSERASALQRVEMEYAATQRQKDVEHAAALHEKDAEQAGALQRMAVGHASELHALRTQHAAMLEKLGAANEQLSGEQAQRVAQLAESESRAHELEEQIAELEGAVRVLHEELRVSRDRTVSGDTERAAAETIARLQSELRDSGSRLAETLESNDELRAALEAAGHSLAEREELIGRLETEAAHSAALLDSVQHSVHFLDATSANGDDVEEHGDTRVLVRMDGDKVSDVPHVLGHRTSIGRTPDNDLQLDTKFVSRHHAVIVAGPVHTIVEDLNSTNGLLVNGRRVTRQMLKDGDTLAVGKTQFRFSVRPPGERQAL